jgi:hypothetical protein
MTDVPDPSDLLTDLASTLSATGSAALTLGAVDLGTRARLLHVARDIAHATERQNAPLAAYLIGRFVQDAISSGISEADALVTAASAVRALIGEDDSG